MDIKLKCLPLKKIIEMFKTLILTHLDNSDFRNLIQTTISLTKYASNENLSGVTISNTSLE